MGEIEAQPVWRHQRTFLRDVLAKHLPQRLMKQMRRGMVLPDRATPGMIDLKRQLGTRLHRSLFDRSDMSENVAGIFFGVGDLKANAIRTHDAGVADLPARFAVQRRLLE